MRGEHTTQALWEKTLLSIGSGCAITSGLGRVSLISVEVNTCIETHASWIISNIFFAA